MKELIFSLLLVSCFSVHAQVDESVEDSFSMASLTVNRIYKKDFSIPVGKLADLIDKEVKVSACVDAYVETQSKTYAKKVQDNLYNLIHNFDNIVSKINGKKTSLDNVPYVEKLEALAKVQCEAYYAIGVLK